MNKVNNCLTLISGQRDIPFVSHSETIDKSKHLNGRKVQLNCSWLKDFAENQASHVSKSKFWKKKSHPHETPGTNLPQKDR